MFANAITFATLLTAAAAGCVRPSSTSSAAPSGPTTIPAGGKFSIMSLRSASPIHFGQTSASSSGIYLNAPKGSEGAVCTDGKNNSGEAIFYIKDGSLFLYTPASEDVQKFWVDRSGMGQGIIGYTTGAGGAPANAESTGFALDSSNDLTFNGAGFIACPNALNGGWSIWVSAGVANPGGNENCLGFSARAVESVSPVACEYSHQ